MSLAMSMARTLGFQCGAFGIRVFLSPFSHDGKGRKRSSRLFPFVLFPMMEKDAKDQADGKCSRTGSFAPTVGIALARSVRAGV